MKRILLSIALPLAIVAVASQFAPAEVEVADEPAIEDAAVEEAVAVDVAIANVDVALAPSSPAVRADGTVDFKRLLDQNPDLVRILIDRMGEGGDGEYGEMIQLALISMDGAAIPHVLEILNEMDDKGKRQLVAGLLGTAAIFPNYPLEAVVPVFVKLAKSDDEETREIGVLMLAQVLHFQGMSEPQRAALQLEIQSSGF